MNIIPFLMAKKGSGKDDKHTEYFVAGTTIFTEAHVDNFTAGAYFWQDFALNTGRTIYKDNENSVYLDTPQTYGKYSFNDTGAWSIIPKGDFTAYGVLRIDNNNPMASKNYRGLMSLYYSYEDTKCPNFGVYDANTIDYSVFGGVNYTLYSGEEVFKWHTYAMRVDRTLSQIQFYSDGIKLNSITYTNIGNLFYGASGNLTHVRYLAVASFDTDSNILTNLQTLRNKLIL